VGTRKPIRYDVDLTTTLEGEMMTERDRGQPQHHSMMTSLLITAAVALISGVVGAMGYSHFVDSKSGEPSAAPSKSEAGSSKETRSGSKGGGGSNTDSAKESSAQALTSSSTSGFGATQEGENLKQQIVNLNKRIDRLGEDVARLQELLSLAVPLLQRMAPKQ
jgi:hypothetical protein